MPDPFTIFPAIDLRAGKVVRLAQGDPGRQTIYGENPRLWAERWKSEGADWLHVINLDGAFGDGTRLTMQALAAVLSTGLKVEFGGGIRDQVSIKTAFDLGVRRVFLGTAAIQNPVLVDWAIATYGPARIAGDIGARDGKVTIRGWQESTALTVLEAGQHLRRQGLEWCVLTDVRRDGISSGIDVTDALELQNATGMQVVASGGVSSLEDVQHVRAAGLAGVIIGRALYEGKISLHACFRSNDFSHSRLEQT
ncbi:MAG: 1-(5-phosphoribosyl)-5-[(5-phosphoribosylamino)methylideneamino] imidazole-4-carboxamide isomerase [Anaerolineales bacterium]